MHAGSFRNYLSDKVIKNSVVLNFKELVSWCDKNTLAKSIVISFEHSSKLLTAHSKFESQTVDIFENVEDLLKIKLNAADTFQVLIVDRYSPTVLFPKNNFHCECKKGAFLGPPNSILLECRYMTQSTQERALVLSREV